MYDYAQGEKEDQDSNSGDKMHRITCIAAELADIKLEECAFKKLSDESIPNPRYIVTMLQVYQHLCPTANNAAEYQSSAQTLMGDLGVGGR